MSASAKLNTSVTTPRFRNSFPQVFTPKFNQLSKQNEYSVQALFEAGADFTALKTAMKNACINKWGANEANWPKNLRTPMKLQKDLIENAAKKGQMTKHLDPKASYMVFKTTATDKNGAKRPHPPVVGKDPKVTIEEESKFYAGCWAKANVTAGAYEKGANSGVTFYLNALQFVGDAEPFSGRPNVETAFEAIPDDVIEGGGSAADMFK